MGEMKKDASIEKDANIHRWFEAQVKRYGGCYVEITDGMVSYSWGKRDDLGDVMTQALDDVVAERQRQIAQEGWTTEHDDTHDDGELAAAAAAYAINAADQLHPQSQGDGNNEAHMIWPWDAKWWKPSTPRRDLVKAAALILAQIEQLDRAAPSPPRAGLMQG